MSNARSKDQRPVVAMDWSLHGVHVTFDGEVVTFYPSVKEFVESLETPHQICAEATFESWDAAGRAAIVIWIRSRGHELYVYRPIHTARARGDMPKSDANDARVIYSIAGANKLHLYPIPDVDSEWATFRQECNREYQKLRLSGTGKDALVKSAEAILGPYKELDDETRSVLGNGTKYSPALLAATYFAAAHSRSRDVYERLLGLHGSAHPSLLRSEVHTHSFRWARRRGVQWNTYRRVVRRTLSAYRAAGVIAPAPDQATLP